MRTVFDEPIRQGMITDDGEHVILISRAFVPSSDADAMLDCLGANLGDHAEAAITNVVQGIELKRNSERFARYNRLMQDLLTSRTHLRARSDPPAARSGDATAHHRIRVGTYICRSDCHKGARRQDMKSRAI